MGCRPVISNVPLHTSLHEVKPDDRTGSPSNASGVRSPGIFREFQKCSSLSGSRYRNFPPCRRSASGSKFSAASDIADSVCAKTTNRRFPIRAFPENVFQNRSCRDMPLKFLSCRCFLPRTNAKWREKSKKHFSGDFSILNLRVYSRKNNFLCPK